MNTIRGIGIPETCNQLWNKTKRVWMLTLVISIFSFLKADAQIHRIINANHVTHLNRRKDEVLSPVRSDSLYCIALRVKNIGIDAGIKSMKKKNFEITIEDPLMGQLVCPAATPVIHFNNE